MKHRGKLKREAAPSEGIPVEATEKGQGKVQLEPKVARPLENVLIDLHKPSTREVSSCRAFCYDGLGNQYSSGTSQIEAGKAQISFTAGGQPGMQYAKIWFDLAKQSRPHDRIVNFFLDPKTSITCGNPDISAMYGFSRDSIKLNRRRYSLPDRQVVGYTTADSTGCLDLWLRDMFYNAGGYFLFENDITSGYEAMWSRQAADGHFSDFLSEDGSHARMSCESDLEYIAALALEQIWLVTGDFHWLEVHLPTIEKGLAYLTSDPTRWDSSLQMVIRGHTCDTWDFDIETEEYSPKRRVAAVCDQAGLYAAWQSLGKMHTALGNESQAQECSAKATSLKKRCDALLWDGKKYQHHHHVDSMDHGAFDESGQLAMGNTWAMTRGIADRTQSLSIIQEYESRWQTTGSRFPWWSLEPGYPAEQGAVIRKHLDYLRPGGYCNGGMMPWVGASLALAAFQNGREELGAKLILEYATFLQEQNGDIYTWYWPNMEPGFRTNTPNTTSHDGWGMGYWMDTLVKGLIGVRITEAGCQAIELSPRWNAAQINEAAVTIHYPASENYISYSYQAGTSGVKMFITGTCKSICLRLLVPKDRELRSVRNGTSNLKTKIEQVEQSKYIVLTLDNGPVWEIAFDWQ